jgi:hypothetical protein
VIKPVRLVLGLATALVTESAHPAIEQPDSKAFLNLARVARAAGAAERAVPPEGMLSAVGSEGIRTSSADASACHKRTKRTKMAIRIGES